MILGQEYSTALHLRSARDLIEAVMRALLPGDRRRDRVAAALEVLPTPMVTEFASTDMGHPDGSAGVGLGRYAE